MNETTKPKTQKEKRDEKINRIVKISKELEILINQSIINQDLRVEFLILIKELNDLCKAQSTILRLAYMIYFFKNLPEDKKELYTRGLIGALKKVLTEQES